MLCRRVGILDVGSNSVRLYVADADCGTGEIRRVYTDKITSRLLQGAQDGVLASEAISRTMDAIVCLADKARQYQAECIEAFGTSAMRDGKNSSILQEKAESMGIPLRILSGEQEADLAFRGFRPKGQAVILDIGGGSTELLAGEDNDCKASCSVPMGALRLAAAMEYRMDTAEMLERSTQVLTKAWHVVEPYAPEASENWIGVGGTITSLAAMCMQLRVYRPEAVEGFYLTIETVETWLERLCAMSLEQRKEIPGLNPERADIIPFGTAILISILRMANVPGLKVSEQDNLPGYIRTYVLPGMTRSAT